MTDSNYKNFTVATDDADVVRVVLDVPDRPMNVIDESVITELEQIVADLELRDDIRLIVFKSGKESGFLAGADVNVISGIENGEQASQIIRRGQQLFARIERLNTPTLAMIHGPCLGGGLEWALACDYRIARDNSSTKIGLPEIQLGLIPGWGGTQRLPRAVGLRAALNLILTGKHLSASDAFRMGLLDRAISPGRWRDEVGEVIARLVSGHSIRSPRNAILGVRRKLESFSPVRHLILNAARKHVAKKTDHYPALGAAITAIESGYRPRVDGYAIEREQFASLIATPTCKQLLRLFHSRENARNLKTWCPEAARSVYRSPIRTLGVIGAGAMGAGIAQVAAIKGYRVRVKEADARAADAGDQRIDGLIDRYAKRKSMASQDRDELRRRISVSDALGEFEDVDCVVEAVVERMDVKQTVLAEAERAVGGDAVLATNTSALSVTEMAEQLRRPERFAGLHFFNPVHRMELVEVVRGKQTNDSTTARLVSFVKALGKTPVVTKDSPGFLVNRILFPYLGEAVLMVREGHDIGMIDREIRRFGMPMGPLELLDQVGLDVACHVADTLRSVLGGVDQVLDTLHPLVERDELGAKTKLGFYDHRSKRKQARDPAAILAVVSTPPATFEFAPDGLTEIQRRLIYPMLAEAIRCQQEGVVEQDWAIDLAMVLGTGFAPHRGGPLSVVNQITMEVFLQNLFRLKRQLGDRFGSPFVQFSNAQSSSAQSTVHANREHESLSKGAQR